MDVYDVNRASYDGRLENYRLSDLYKRSKRYCFDVTIDAEAMVYRVVITRKDTNTILCCETCRTPDEVSALIDGWWMQLTIAERPIDMGANR